LKFPRLTIAAPVFNGGATLPRLLDSLLAQTFTDLQVVIIDNASTDNTGEVAAKYQAADSRVHYLRHKTNAGAHISYNEGVHLGLFSDYVAYVGHNDAWAPQNAERSIEALEAQPTAVLAYGYVSFTDAEGKNIISQYHDDYEISGDDPGQRYITFLEKVNWCTAHYSIMRSEPLRSINPLMIQFNASGDNLLLARLALLGPFIQLPEQLLFRAMPGATKQETFAQRYGRIQIMSQYRNEGIYLPYCRWVKDHCDAVMMTALTNQEKNRLCDQTIRILLGRYRGNFITEIDRAVDLILKGEFHKNWEDELEKKPVIQRPGIYKALDFVRLAKLTQELNYALGLLPQHPGLNCALGAVYALLGRHEEAKVMFEKELKHNPGFKPAQDYAAQYRKASSG